MNEVVVALLAAAALLLATRPAGGGRVAPARSGAVPAGWGPTARVGSRRRCRRTSRAARRGPPEPSAALLLDLCAAALSAGAPPAVALQVAGQAAGGELGRRCDLAGSALLLGATHESAWEGAPAALDPVRHGVRLVVEAGVPGAELMRGAAAAERARGRRRSEARAQALGVRIVLPLGVCALPAFAAWGVVPVVLALAGQLL